MADLSAPLIVPCELGAPPALQSRQIHVYVAPVAELATGWLNAEEQQRAARFLDPTHRDRYTRIRATLRSLLANYLHVSPTEVTLDYAPFGKPQLRGAPALHFNLSHSRYWAAFAFRLDAPLGVDIENMRPQKNLHGMLGHVASAREQAAVTALPAADRLTAFYRLWTRKEAFIKGVGRGLGMGLRRIHIGIDDTSPRAVEYDEQTLPPWYVQDLSAPQNYRLAVCSHILPSDD